MGYTKRAVQRVEKLIIRLVLLLSIDSSKDCYSAREFKFP